jgi:uncharacterized protein (TIGR03437 family)
MRIVSSLVFLALLLQPLFAQGQNRFAIVNGASFQSPPLGLARGQIISLFSEFELNVDPTAAKSLPLPTQLAGIKVLAGEIPVPLFYVSPKQINLLIPYEIRESQIRINVMQGDKVLGYATRFPTGKFDADFGPINGLFPTSVGIFRNYNKEVSYSYGGYNYKFFLPLITGRDWKLVDDKNPLRDGEYYTIWATGLGQVDPPVKSGEAGTTPLHVSKEEVAVYIQAIESNIIEKMPVIYAGLAPEFVGLYQVNFKYQAIKGLTPPLAGFSRLILRAGSEKMGSSGDPIRDEALHTGSWDAVNVPVSPILQ